MEYTKKYKLSKPTYDDDVDIKVINNNMDIIDGKLQNVSMIDNTLHIDNNSYPLNFLPLTGGNLTGELTVQGKDVVNIVDSWRTKDWFWVKYSDGRLVIGGRYDAWDYPHNLMVHITFPIPFINDQYIVIANLVGDRINIDNPNQFNIDIDHPPYIHQVSRTATGCYIARDDYAIGVYFLCIGSWK